MKKFMLICFGLLAFAFYELSGGADFEPEVRVAAADDASPEIATRANTEVALSASPASGSETIQDRLTTALITPAVSETTLVTTNEVIEPVTATIADPAVVEDLVDEQVVAENTTAPDVAPVDIREVAGSRVNMRDGPGTTYAVLVTLNSGTTAEVIGRNDDGWVRVRVQDSGLEGWMAERLLSPANG